MRAHHVVAVALGAILTAGCAAEYGTVTTVGYAPELVYVSPGVQVIADWSEPIFFVDGFYWRLYGGAWYRSTYYSGGWLFAPPPPVLLHVDHPYAYSHYRPHGWAPGRYNARPAPVVRDHRTPRPPPAPPPRDRGRDHDRDHRR